MTDPVYLQKGIRCLSLVMFGYFIAGPSAIVIVISLIDGLSALYVVLASIAFVAGMAIAHILSWRANKNFEKANYHLRVPLPAQMFIDIFKGK